VLAEHTAEHRAIQLEAYLAEANGAAVKRPPRVIARASEPGAVPLE
jgi:hypothetical protein